MKPELSKAHLGIEDRNLEYEKKIQLQPHIVYFAISSHIKVGVTRKSQLITRWIDQGADRALAIFEFPNRYLAGTCEVILKKSFSDKTNWRKMLSSVSDQSLNFNKAEEFVDNNIEENKGRVEQRMFFPWMIKKTLYNEIGGNDELFSKYMVDDDDFYLRVKMSGAKYTQVFETAVYHMPSKSVRMREDDSIKVDVDGQYQKSIRNFIRKWGTWPGRVWDENRDMIIPKKHDIGFVVNNCMFTCQRNLIITI